MQAWALGPIVGLAGSAIIGGAMAYQISQINKQPAPEPPKLTALAVGGIATGPTTALIGEGGEPEMVLPLSKARDMGFGKKSDIVYHIEGNTFVGIDGIDELIMAMEERKDILRERGMIA